MVQVKIGEKTYASKQMIEQQNATARKAAAQAAAVKPAIAAAVKAPAPATVKMEREMNVMLSMTEKLVTIILDTEKRRVEIYGLDNVLEERKRREEQVVKVVSAIGGLALEFISGVIPALTAGTTAVIEASAKAETLRVRAQGEKDAAEILKR